MVVSMRSVAVGPLFMWRPIMVVSMRSVAVGPLFMWRPIMVVSMRSVAILSVRCLLQCSGSRLVYSGLGSSSQIHTRTRQFLTGDIVDIDLFYWPVRQFYAKVDFIHPFRNYEFGFCLIVEFLSISRLIYESVSRHKVSKIGWSYSVDLKKIKIANFFLGSP